MSLPSGYKRLEYIQSSGTQYIDTGLSAPTGMRVQCDVELTSLRSGLNMLFGSHDASDPYYRNYLAASSNGYWEIGAYGLGTFGSVTTGRKYNIDVCTISGSLSAKIDGTAYAIGNIAPSTKRSDLNVYLFALNYAGGLLWSSMKLYSAKIYLDAAGSSPARDFIPCKNASGVVGLWDDANSKFYTNAGTGVFTAGPEVKGTNKTLIDGTAYGVKTGKCLISGTAYAVKKGRTLIGGTGYDIELPSDADGLTWYLNETVDLTSDMEFSVDFYSNAERCTGIQIMDFMGRALMYRIASSNSWTMRFGFGRWEAEGYRTLVFDEVPTGTLLEWLQANGTAI